MTANLRRRSVIIEVLLHVAIWVIVFILPHYLLIYNDEDSPELYSFILKKTLFYVLLFYLNYFILFPYLFYRRRKILYVFAAIVTTFLVFFVSEIVIEETRPRHNETEERKIHEEEVKKPDVLKPDDRRHEPGHKPPPRFPLAYNNLVTFFLITGAGLGLRFAKKIQETEQRRKEAEQEKLNTELVMLKNQIHPHFFFNTLNNIYALIEVNSPNASDAVLKLSRLMRYVIYESETKSAMLSREIEFMKNYIDLMKLRLSNKVTLEVDFPADYSDTEIQPLLLITFVENAFKHGISYSMPSFISIAIKVNSGCVEFTCRNSIVTTHEELTQESTGLGLDNIRKRLQMLYPEKHELSIRADNSVFDVYLKINT